VIQRSDSGEQIGPVAEPLASASHSRAPGHIAPKIPRHLISVGRDLLAGEGHAGETEERNFSGEACECISGCSVFGCPYTRAGWPPLLIVDLALCGPDKNLAQQLPLRPEDADAGSIMEDYAQLCITA
jgi:hypothetical protein